MRRIGTGARLVVSLALVGSHLLLAGSADAETSEPLMLTGKVVGKASRGLADATVAVYALNDLGHEIAAIPLGRAKSDSAGKFEVRGALRDTLPRQPDGSVSLEVSVLTSAGRHKFFGLDAQPPGAGRTSWKAVDEQGIQLSMAGARAGLTKSQRASVAGNAAAYTLAPSEQSAAASGRCPLYAHYSWVPNGNVTTTRWIVVQSIRTRNHANQVYSWDTTKRTRTQVVYAGVGANYAGGLSYAQNHDSSAGAQTSPAGSYWAGYVKAHWRYRQWKQVCYNDNDPARTDTGERKWLPKNWTGGFKKVPDASVGLWSCKAKWDTVIAGRLWVARRTSTLHNGQFTIAGVGLDSAQTNSSSHRLTIKAHASESARICGSNNDPIYAKRIIEGFK